jgi:Domain of unknown function (DUF5060)/Putative collagen-binding domain of a collagenase
MRTILRRMAPRKRLQTGLCVGVLLLAWAGCRTTKPTVSGDLQVWHKVTVDFEGPETSENATPNPFRDFRLNVTFTHPQSGEVYIVPGFFAADGNAAETSAKAGNKWRVHFTPDREGQWDARASFRTGTDVAMSLAPEAGAPAAFDGAAESFQVGPTDKSGRDARAKGMLRYTGEHYLRRAGNNEYFLKGGADSPENFLGYFDFDDTSDTGARFNEGENKEGEFVHHYAPHEQDWREGDPVWQQSKGKGIIGALNYLAGKGMNSVYFLTYNIDGGDGKDVWMWSSPDVRDRYDCSKLDQWEIVFSHMDRLGLMLHVITQETENDSKLGGSAGLNPERMLYYRELVARFSHHLAVVWNQGEENNTGDADRKEIARYIRELDPYDHPITVHTHNNRTPEFYDGLLGDPGFEATSIQGSMENYNNDAIVMRQRTASAGRKWAIFGDEQSTAQVGVMPDQDDPDHDIPRIQALWGNLIGGGSGVEWYFGYNYPNMDLNCEDWRSRDRMWDQTRYALEFFHQYLPFWDMGPDNSLASGARNARVLAKPGEVYAVQLPSGGAVRLKLGPGEYSVRWYDPRAGGQLQQGNTTSVEGPGPKPLGNPPSEPGKDWVVLVKKG